jgi:putative endonuclease
MQRNNSSTKPLHFLCRTHNHNDVIPNRREAAVRKPLSAGAWTMPEEKLYYVYILSSKSRAIYVGMTGFLMTRVLSHRAGEGGAFTRKYRIHRLVYYEVFRKRRGRDRARDRNQEVEAGEECSSDRAE